MRFMATADTDIGISKKTNQDSILIKHAKVDGTEALLAIICDGMGGLYKGELASAAVIRAFSKWFDEELPYKLRRDNLQGIGVRWAELLKKLNIRIGEYAGEHGGQSIGTTFAGIFLYGDRYVIGNVGDTRVYHIGREMTQLTTDQTFVAREVARGTMTPEQAETDKRRNLLLQCVGASRVVEPQIICGEIKSGAYMICSDGFRHEITEEEMYEALAPCNLTDKETMHGNAKYLIEQVKTRGEKDNISVLLIKAE